MDEERKIADHQVKSDKYNMYEINLKLDPLNLHMGGHIDQKMNELKGTVDEGRIIKEMIAENDPEKDEDQKVNK